MNDTENVIVRLNSLTQRVHEAVTAMDNAFDLKDANEKVAELTELVNDQGDKIDALEDLLRFHRIDPASIEIDDSEASDAEREARGE